LYYITFLRHGESQGNSAGVLQGQSDYPLTAAGLDQARKLASYWKSIEIHFDLIISSPLQRASQTAEIIADYLKVPIEFDPAWKERNFGHLQGSNLHELDDRTPPVDFFHPFESIGGKGESQLDLYLRAGKALQNILRQPAGSYLIVSHGGILNKALYVILGITPQGHYNSPIFHYGNTGYAQCRYNSATRQWAIICLNREPSDVSSEGAITWRQD
jgi:2,3-bisphosphoglycerate-dependent phosphoglycerate mutase